MANFCYGAILVSTDELNRGITIEKDSGVGFFENLGGLESYLQRNGKELDTLITVNITESHIMNENDLSNAKIQLEYIDDIITRKFEHVKNILMCEEK